MPDAGSAGSSSSAAGSGLAQVPSARPLERHARLGPYQICLEVASGGMATVYLARSAARVGRDRFVALKVAHPHLARDPAFVAMFADEARLASLIQHPHVCRVLDFEGGSVPYIAMEYLAGENLASIYGRYVEHLAARPPEQLDLERHAARVARAMADACAGLHAAHELCDEDGTRLDVVHRDVSPENLFLTFGGAVKVIDFGVAQAARQRHRTSTGFVKGKLAYLQPEALENEPIDRRADVWGVGVTTWELLTGERLFRREGDLETIRAIGELAIRAPSEVRPGLPPEFDPIVLRALERDREARYATARDMARDLLGALASRGPIPDMVDLAGWMDELFPGGRLRSRRLLELGQKIADDCADLVESEPTRRRACLRPPPPVPSSAWPLSPREMASVKRPGGRRAVALAALLGVVIGAAAAWALIAPGASLAADSGKDEAPDGASAQRTFEPSTELLLGRDSLDVVPHGVSRTWDDARPDEGSPGTYAFEIGDDAQEIILRFRRGSGAPPER